MPFHGAADPDHPVHSGGPCPGCEGRGALLILRRIVDGTLLFHCPTCGLSFTHVPPGAEPESARSLEGVAPGGAGPATEAEIRRAGLARYARPWTGGAHGSAPAAAGPEPAPLPELRPAREVPNPPKEGKPGCLGGAFGVLIVLKILAILLKSCGN
jgi:hypothetical protein